MMQTIQFILILSTIHLFQSPEKDVNTECEHNHSFTHVGSRERARKRDELCILGFLSAKQNDSLLVSELISVMSFEVQS